jgi:RNA polymerase-binding protein DksA
MSALRGDRSTLAAGRRGMMERSQADREQKRELYLSRLNAEKETLLDELKELNEGNLEMLQSDMSGETAHGEHPADNGNARFERERDLGLENNIKDMLNRIDAAIAKLEEGTYGECDRCGGEIDPARLKAVPYANLCIECKTNEESKR